MLVSKYTIILYPGKKFILRGLKEWKIPLSLLFISTINPLIFKC